MMAFLTLIQMIILLKSWRKMSVSLCPMIQPVIDRVSILKSWRSFQRRCAFYLEVWILAMKNVSLRIATTFTLSRGIEVAVTSLVSTKRGRLVRLCIIILRSMSTLLLNGHQPAIRWTRKGSTQFDRLCRNSRNLEPWDRLGQLFLFPPLESNENMSDSPFSPLEWRKRTLPRNSVIFFSRANIMLISSIQPTEHGGLTFSTLPSRKCVCSQKPSTSIR